MMPTGYRRIRAALHPLRAQWRRLKGTLSGELPGENGYQTADQAADLPKSSITPYPVRSNPDQVFVSHPIFEQFDFHEHKPQEGFRLNGLGVREREYFYDHTVITTWKDRSAVRPMVEEEYFEWIDLLESVTLAKGQFTIIELGAGYGPWVVNAIAALRQKNPLPFKIIAVEADSIHFQYLKQNLIDNDIDPDAQDLLMVAVAAKSGYVSFNTGSQEQWYGQAVISDNPDALHRILLAINRFTGERKRRNIGVKAITLNSILDKTSYVDLLDIDIQGMEFDVLNASIDKLNKKVKRVHVGTHAREIDTNLEQLFVKAGWENKLLYPCFTKVETPYGIVDFNDGVQSWINPRI